MTKTLVAVFPFDLFGNAGTARGAELLADALREMLADNRRETRPTRSLAYQDQLRFREFHFETLSDYDGWRKSARRVVRQALERGEFLLWLSGNHLGVLPVYEELGVGPARDQRLILQFDAHLDVYNLADCTEELSHGNFLRHAEGPLPPVVNVGHRDLFLTREYIAEHFRAAFAVPGWAKDPAEIESLLGGAAQLFVDLDCDVFDPAFFPAVHQPQPFGLAPREVLELIGRVEGQRLGGLFISEFDPGRDQHDRSLSTLVWLIEYVLLRRYER